MHPLYKPQFATLVSLIISVSSICAQSNNALLSNSKLAQLIQAATTKAYPALHELYLHLHKNPELSFHEEKTAARLSQEIAATGFEVTTKIGGHGFVGVLQNGEGPTVMVRTDLDALPITENTGLPYASIVRTIDEQGVEVGVMHACGHDIHMSVFAGAARILGQMKELWRGTLVFVGQPAEERGGGAREMLNDGLFTRFPRPDYCLALHANASLPAGKVGYCSGYALANVDMIDLTVFGVGGHGAYPHTTKDPIVLASQIILALQTIVSRETEPIEPCVVTVGAIHGGTKHNIIPDEVKLQLTLRSYSDEVREHTIAAIKRMVKGLAEAAGVPADRMPVLHIRNEYTPSTYNSPELVQRLVPVFQDMLGEENVTEVEPVMAGEDFSRYGRVEPKIPSFIFSLGTVPEQKFQASMQNNTALPSLHSSTFAPDPEPTIRTGVQAMAAAVLNLTATQ